MAVGLRAGGGVGRGRPAGLPALDNYNVDYGDAGLDEIWQWDPEVKLLHAPVHTDDGTLVAGFDAANASNGGGFAGDFYGITLGANYKPNANVVFRPEVRWDWYSGLDGTGGAARPYDGGVDSSQTTLAFDVIVLF